MSNDTFSRLYIQPPSEPLEDSARARNRIGARVLSLARDISALSLADYVHRELGVRIDRGGKAFIWWDVFLQKCQLRDLLDIITLIGRYSAHVRGKTYADSWFNDIRRIFAQEHLAYTIDAAGVVHLAVDQEFHRNRLAAIAGLQGPRYANVLNIFEKVADFLVEQPPNAKEAWRTTFSASEGLFKLIFPTSPRLTASEIDRHMSPLLVQVYGTDDTALRASQRLLKSFKEWVEASHNYRHEQGTEEPTQAPLELAIVGISEGTTFLRWLRKLDPQAPQ